MGRQVRAHPEVPVLLASLDVLADQMEMEGPAALALAGLVAPAARVDLRLAALVALAALADRARGVMVLVAAGRPPSTLHGE